MLTVAVKSVPLSPQPLQHAGLNAEQDSVHVSGNHDIRLDMGTPLISELGKQAGGSLCV